MRIDNTDTKVIFEFSPRTHLLVHAIDARFTNAKILSWSLNPRIDRSYKGKDDDIGVEEIYVSDEKAEQLKKAGFTYTEFDEDKV